VFLQSVSGLEDNQFLTGLRETGLEVRTFGIKAIKHTNLFQNSGALKTHHFLQIKQKLTNIYTVFVS
jgi:hypothetical protein